MLALDESDVRQIAANSPALDELALRVVDEVTKLDLNAGRPPYGVVFEKINGALKFRAKVHCVDIVVTYEQEIEKIGRQRFLSGVFRARLDEAAKVDRELVSSFRFDSGGGTTSTGDFLGDIAPGEARIRSIRDAVALILAHDVQQHLDISDAK